MYIKSLWSILSRKKKKKHRKNILDIVFLPLSHLTPFSGSSLSLGSKPMSPGLHLTSFPAAAKLLQSCLTLCNPIDGSPPGSAIPGILQARTLEWVAISFSNARKWKVNVKSLSRVRLFTTPWTATYQAPLSMGFSSKSTGMGCHCLLHLFLLFWLYSRCIKLLHLLFHERFKSYLQAFFILSPPS